MELSRFNSLRPLISQGEGKMYLTPFLQIKSRTSTKEFEGYAKDFKETDAHARMFFVWHTGTINVEPIEQITLWGPDKVAKMVLEAGLLSWLKDRVS